MITKQEFKEYDNIRQSGVVNMWDIDFICQHTGLTDKKCFEIMKTFGKLKEKYQNG